MPSCTNSSFIAAFSKVFVILRAREYQPALNVMDNSCSKAVEKHIQANKKDIQLVPPHNHDINAAERAIAMLKKYFVAAFATVDMLCPYSFGMNFYHKLNLHSVFYCSPVATRVVQPTRNFTAHLISTKHLLPLLGQRAGLQQSSNKSPLGAACNCRVLVRWPGKQPLPLFLFLHSVGSAFPLFGHVAAVLCPLPSPCCI
jgi:hypothetical protein